MRSYGKDVEIAPGAMNAKEYLAMIKKVHGLITHNGRRARVVIEAFCNQQSMIGFVGDRFGHKVKRFTEADDLMSRRGK